MEVSYIILLFIIVVAIVSLIKDILQKRWIACVFDLLIVPWVIQAIMCLRLGGSTYNNAAEAFVGYQQGHYYLVEHNNFTEVSREVFMRLRIMETIGWLCFITSFIFCIVRNIRSKNWSKPPSNDLYFEK